MEIRLNLGLGCVLLILKNLTRPRYAPVMIQKVKTRLLDRTGSREIEENLAWLRRNCEELEPIATRLEASLWEESKEYADELRAKGEEVLNGLKVKLGGGGYYRLLYFISRHLKPSIVVETGVAAGFSTQAILKSMQLNDQGTLYSSEYPYIRYQNPEQYIGTMVEEDVKDRWKLYIDGDRKNLREILKEISQIDIFHYDSDKSYSGREFAMNEVSTALSEEGIIIMDDIQDNLFFHDYVRESHRSWRVFEYDGKYVGVIGL